MAKSNTTTPKSTEAPTTYTPTHCPKTGRKLTKEERRAANKAKWAKEQAALAAKRKKAKDAKAKAKANKPTAKKAAAPAPTAKRVPVADVKRWMEQHPNRKTVSTVDITDWMALPANTKVGKRLSRKNTLDAQMSKRNNKLEVQAQRKGGLRA